MTRLAPAPVRFSMSRRRRMRRRRVTVGVSLLLAFAGLLYFGPRLLSLVRADVLPGTTIGGVDVGGLDEAALQSVLEDVATERMNEPLVVRRGLVDARVTGEVAEVRASAGEAGYRFDVDASAAPALALGRRANPFDAWADHLASFRGGRAFDVVEYVNEDTLTAWSESTAEALAIDPIEGMVAFEGASVVRTDPEPGIVVDAARLAELTREALLDRDAGVIDAPVEAVEPTTTVADVDAAEALAARVVSGPVELSRDGGRLVLEPARLAELVEVVRREEEPRLTLHLDPTRLRESLDDTVVAGFERDPVDAEIRLAGGAITISESADGFRFDAAATATQVLDLSTGNGPRSATLEGQVVPPDLSTEDARELRIAEPTGTFTTHFTPGQSRVQNIRRIAELVNGVVLRPGESFSVNDHVGERTVEKGFAPGGAILDGEFVEQIGGGVSQFATTMYNAAYFGGYELVRYQAHSYYIDRYPMGREATLNYPTIDLEIRNNSPYGLLIEATSTASSVTVTTWGTQWVEVESVTGNPTNVRSGRVRNGFDVVDTRVLRFPDGRVEREERFTRYRPES
jgi:vancomycin resistance protein YoaR